MKNVAQTSTPIVLNSQQQQPQQLQPVPQSLGDPIGKKSLRKKKESVASDVTTYDNVGSGPGVPLGNNRNSGLGVGASGGGVSPGTAVPPDSKLGGLLSVTTV